MRAGQLRTRLIVQKLSTPTLDSYGAPSQAWVEWRRTWADVEELSGTESLVQGGIEAQASHLIKIRFIAGLTPKMRFKDGSRLYQIVHVGDLDRRTRMQRVTVAEVTGVA